MRIIKSFPAIVALFLCAVLSFSTFVHGQEGAAVTVSDTATDAEKEKETIPETASSDDSEKEVDASSSAIDDENAGAEKSDVEIGEGEEKRVEEKDEALAATRESNLNSNEEDTKDAVNDVVAAGEEESKEGKEDAPLESKDDLTTPPPPLQSGPLVDLLGGTLLSLKMIDETHAQMNTHYTNDALSGKKVIGLYFSADW